MTTTWLRGPTCRDRARGEGQRHRGRLRELRPLRSEDVRRADPERTGRRRRHWRWRERHGGNGSERAGRDSDRSAVRRRDRSSRGTNLLRDGCAASRRAAATRGAAGLAGRAGPEDLDDNQSSDPAPSLASASHADSDRRNGPRHGNDTQAPSLDLVGPPVTPRDPPHKQAPSRCCATP